VCTNLNSRGSNSETSEIAGQSGSGGFFPLKRGRWGQIFNRGFPLQDDTEGGNPQPDGVPRMVPADLKEVSGRLDGAEAPGLDSLGFGLARFDLQAQPAGQSEAGGGNPAVSDTCGWAIPLVHRSAAGNRNGRCVWQWQHQQ